MQVEGSVAMITGGAGGLGFATAQHLAAGGAAIALLDLNEAKGREAEEAIGPNTAFFYCDVRDPVSVAGAVNAASDRFGSVRILVNTAGVGTAQRLVGKDGSLFDLELFKFTIDVNLIGMFDVIRNVAGHMARNDPLDTGERGVMVNVASIAAFDGQIGQAAYSASKGGVVGMTLPLARDLGSYGIRVVTVAPGIFSTPLLSMLPEAAVQNLEGQAVFPRRLGRPEEFARMVESIVANPYLNGSTIRLDAATRMPPR